MPINPPKSMALKYKIFMLSTLGLNIFFKLIIFAVNGMWLIKQQYFEIALQFEVIVFYFNIF